MTLGGYQMLDRFAFGTGPQAIVHVHKMGKLMDGEGELRRLENSQAQAAPEHRPDTCGARWTREVTAA